MADAREARRRGREYLDAVTELLQRIRSADASVGLYEAAEVPWWWAERERTTDAVDQLFWLDAAGAPIAAVIANEFADDLQLDPLVMPGADAEWRTHVMERGLVHATQLGFTTAMLEVDAEDALLQSLLVRHGFTIEPDGGLVESWLDPDRRPAVSPLPAGYQLRSRDTVTDRPHHMINPARRLADPERRLRQTSLYRPDLDLVVYDDRERVAAYGLCWYDPVTRVGVVEPMRTEDDHQRRGLARHVLTAGIDRLAAAGAERIKICYEPANPASGHLYLSAGFEPARHNDMASGPL